MTIEEMTKTEIGEELVRLASLTGMKLPEDPPLTAQWIKKKWGGFYKALLREGFDWYCEGNLDLKSRDINAMNVSRILNAFIKVSKGEYYKKKIVETKEEQNKAEEERSNKKAMKYTAERYYKDVYCVDSEFKLIPKSLEVLCDWIVEKGWVVPQEIDEDRRQMLRDKLTMYVKRKAQYLQNEAMEKSHFHAIARTRQLSNPTTDFEKAIVTAHLIEKRIEDGYEPMS